MNGARELVATREAPKAIQKLGQPSLNRVRKACSTVKPLYTAYTRDNAVTFQAAENFEQLNNFEKVLSSQTFKIVNDFNVQISVPIVAV